MGQVAIPVFMKIVTFKAYLLDNRTYQHLLVVRRVIGDYLVIFLARHRTGKKSRFIVNQKNILFHTFVRYFSENR